MTNRSRITTAFSEPKIRLRRLVRNRIAALIAIVSTVAIGTSVPITALAVHDTGWFELDGNIAHDSATTPPYDWASLFDASGNRIVTPDPNNGPLLASVFTADSALPDASYFTSNKDTDPINTGVPQQWGCTTINNPLAKDNLLNAYAALIQIPANAPDNAGHTVLYVGSERGSNNGDSFAGFWLFKDKNVGCTSGSSFTGSHQDGDILVVSNYTNGGGTQAVQVYKWAGGPSGGPVLDTALTGGICGGLAADMSCAIANTVTITSPWAPTSHASNTFVEAGIDLTALFPSGGSCFTTFMAETRSSQELTATLKDFAGGQFNTCPPPPIVTTATPGGSVTTGTAQHDVATISAVGSRPAPTGTITFNLCSPAQVTVAGCPQGSGTQVGSPVAISSAEAISADVTGLTTPGDAALGKYCWSAAYTPDTASSGFYVPSFETNATTECFTVVKAQPSISTDNVVVSGTGAVGHTTIHDIATLTGTVGTPGSDTVSFSLFGPYANGVTPSCAGNPVFGPVTGALSGSGGTWTATSPNYTPLASGTYNWVASFAGDAYNAGSNDGNAAATEACNVSAEKITIPLAQPVVTTTRSINTGVVGTDSFADTATLTGGYNLNGQSVTFNLYGPYSAGNLPTSTFCGSATAPAAGWVFSGTGTLSGTNPDGPWTTNSVSAGTLAATGTYYWVAYYGGDANNQPARGGCLAEPITVTPRNPALSTTRSINTGVVGTDSFGDSATATGGFSLNGQSITFNLYGPFTSTPSTTFCGTATAPLSGAVFSATRTLSGTDPNGPWSTGSVDAGVLTQTGTYYWVAYYGGDANNVAVRAGCLDEPITVTPRSPSLTTTRSRTSGTVGTDSFGDSATAMSGYNLNGQTVTFRLYGPFSSTPSDTFCGTAANPTAGWVFSGTGTLSGTNPDGPWTTNTVSAGTLAATGTYYWAAYYGGDSNNNAAVSGCLSEPITVNIRTPHIDTTQTPTQGVANVTTFGDSASVSAGYALNGETVTFKLYGPYNSQPPADFCGSGTAPAAGAVYSHDSTLSGTNPNGPWTAAASDPTPPATVGTYYWVAFYSNTANNDSNNGAATSSCLGEPIHVGDANITISPLTATNAVRTPHTFTATVQVNNGDGNGYVNAPNGTLVTFSLSNSNGATATFDGGVNTCTTTAGSCHVSITSPTAGQTTVTASTTLGVLGVSVTRTTGDSHTGDSASAVKTWVDANITISPLTATNAVGTPHVFTATVMVNNGGGGGFVTAPNGTLVTFGLVNSNGANATFDGGVNTCTTTGGSCHVSITSTSAGQTTVSASTTLSVLGVSLTRTTGDTNAGDGASAVKTWVDAFITITPLTATNVITHQHVFTITVTAITAGASPVVFNSVTTSVTPTPTTQSNTCDSAHWVINGNTLTCTLTINSDVAATYTANATATLHIGGASVTRTTSPDGSLAGPGGSGPATKIYIAPNSSLVKAEEDLSVPDLTQNNGGFAAGPITAHPLDVLEYRLTYSNSGAGAASNVTVTDVVPVAHSGYVAGSCTPACTYDATTHTLTWALGTVNGDSSVVMTFKIALTNDFPIGVTTQVTNAAVVTTAEEGSKPSNTVIANVFVPVQQVQAATITLPQAGAGPGPGGVREYGSQQLEVMTFAAALLLAMTCVVIYESLRRRYEEADELGD